MTGEASLNFVLTPGVIWLGCCSFDTALTKNGRQQARQASATARGLQPPPQLIVTSALSRAIDTALLAFETFSCPFAAHPAASERVWLSADVGLEK